jgi:hypothetical protein
MPQSPNATDEMRANAPKPSQQSKTNLSNGTKARHMDSPGIKDEGRGYGRSTVNPVGWGYKISTDPCSTGRGLAGEVNTSHRGSVSQGRRAVLTPNAVLAEGVGVKRVTGDLPAHLLFVEQDDCTLDANYCNTSTNAG